MQKIILSSQLFASSIWSVNYFADSHEFISFNQNPLCTLRDLVIERKEICSPQSSPTIMYNYIGLENIESNNRILINFAPRFGEEIKSNSKIYTKGDILYGRLRPSLNKVYYVDQNVENGICSTEIFVLKPITNLVDPVFLAEMLASDLVNKAAISLIRGASLPRIQIDDFLDIKIPLPSMHKQKLYADFIARNRKQWIAFRSYAQTAPQYIQESVINSLIDDKPLIDFVEYLRE